jgi:hypothetical protein
MATNGTLQLSTNYIQTGLGTLTYTVPTVVPPNGISTVNIPFVVQCQVTFPQAVSGGFGAGSGADQGLGVTGSSTTYAPTYQTTGAQQGLGNGALGLGFGGSNTDGASGAGSGYGAGGGGGTLGGFSLGGGGTGEGATGRGFIDGGTASGYNQPSIYTNTPTSIAAVLSSLSVVVNQNGSPVYTAPTIEGIQDALKFSTNLLCNANDSITIVFSSSNAADEALNAIKANVSITIGEQ